jgi:hypothetical protein
VTGLCARATVAATVAAGAWVTPGIALAIALTTITPGIAPWLTGRIVARLCGSATREGLAGKYGTTVPTGSNCEEVGRWGKRDWNRVSGQRSLGGLVAAFAVLGEGFAGKNDRFGGSVTGIGIGVGDWSSRAWPFSAVYTVKVASRREAARHALRAVGPRLGIATGGVKTLAFGALALLSLTIAATTVAPASSLVVASWTFASRAVLAGPEIGALS